MEYTFVSESRRYGEQVPVCLCFTVLVRQTVLSNVRITHVTLTVSRP